MEMITQKELKEILNYNPDTGVFIWLKPSARKIKVGSIAGHQHKTKGHRIIIKYKTYAAHRLAFLYMNGYFPKNQIDHINQDQLDNRWCNLREVNNQINNQNKRIRSDNTTGVMGVDKRKNGKYRARINLKGKRIDLGTFDNIEDAIEERRSAEIMFGYNDNHNK